MVNSGLVVQYANAGPALRPGCVARDDIVKVEELSERQVGQERYQIVPGEHNRDCKDRMAYE